jgi:plasmid stabilization system protein ParE
MLNKNKLTVEYSKQALSNAKEIVSYLNNKFTEKEVNNFYQILANFENIIISYPTLYSQSKVKKIRRAVLSSELSVYYQIRKNKISIIAILDNRTDLNSKYK